MTEAPNVDAPNRAEFFFTLCSHAMDLAGDVLAACDKLTMLQVDEPQHEQAATKPEYAEVRALLDGRLRAINELFVDKAIECPSIWLERGLSPPSDGVVFTALPWPASLIWQSVREQIVAVRAAFFANDSLLRKLANPSVNMFSSDVVALLQTVEKNLRALRENLSLPEIKDPAACAAGWRGEVVLRLRELDDACSAFTCAGYSPAYDTYENDSGSIESLLKNSGDLSGHSDEIVEFIAKAMTRLSERSAALLSALASAGENPRIASLACLPLLKGLQQKQHPFYCQPNDIPASTSPVVLLPWQEFDVAHAMRRPVDTFGARMLVWLAACDPARGDRFVEPPSPSDVLPHLVLRWTARPAVLRLASEFTSAIMLAARALSRPVIERD